MTARHDPELDDVLQDDELRRIAHLLSSSTRDEPPVDDAYRSALRRQLMNQADNMVERRPLSSWRRLFAPPGLAWSGAVAGLLLIAAVVVFSFEQQPGSVNQVVVYSAMNGAHSVQLQQPILVSFNQPMDHATTEAAIQVTPATTVTFSWDNNTLSVQPTSGNLAPNTQYQVTVGPGATTAAGKPLSQPTTITFDTQPQPSPTVPSPRPLPTPGNLLTAEQQLVADAGPTSVQWSADSSTVYFVTASGALESVAAKGGTPVVIVADGVTSPAISPAGDQLAYIRGGKIEILTIAQGATTEVSPSSPALVVGWAQNNVIWMQADGVYQPGAAGAPSKVADLPAGGTVTPLAISPDGSHAVLMVDQQLTLLDLSTGASVALGAPSSTPDFAGWSNSGSHVMVVTPDGVAILDLQGNVSATLGAGQPSWSTQNAILLGGDTSVAQVRPDGSAQVKLADGTYNSPSWAPDGATFTFVRGSALWVATAPPLPVEQTALDQASAVVDAFMKARLKQQADAASAYLDSSAQQDYGANGLTLIITGDPSFTRYYILTKELASSNPDVAKFVVRLVLSHEDLDVSDIEETLTLVRNSDGNFVIDQAQAGAHVDLGNGAVVVGVNVTNKSIAITFDSDLDPSTVQGSVSLFDSQGNPISTDLTYANRTVTLAGIDLKPGRHYKLVVSTSLRDVAGHSVASEYDLTFVGPAPSDEVGHEGGRTSPSPTPEVSPTLAASPTESGLPPS